VHRLQEVIDKVEPRVTPEMNASLRSEYTRSEIKEALDGIGDLKAPGPDGMLAIFFKRPPDQMVCRQFSLKGFGKQWEAGYRRRCLMF
jgi:hypothetical protein